MRKVRILNDDEMVVSKHDHHILTADAQMWYIASDFMTDKEERQLYQKWEEEYGGWSQFDE